jgi:hypothetical protein
MGAEGSPRHVGGLGWTLALRAEDFVATLHT